MEFMRLQRAAPDSAEGNGAGDALVFMASTPGTKRDGLDTATLPWRVDTYRTNPVCTWCHDFGGARLPIGRADVEVLNTPAGEFIRAAITFDRADPFAAEVERKYRDGFLHAVSVSWDDVDAAGVPVRSAGGRPVAHELLEIAAVPVPGDPQALQEKRGAALRSMARELIDALEESEAADAEPTTADGVEAVDAVADTDSETECECDGECADATDDCDAEDEDALADLAAGMVDVFDPASDDSDAVRGRRYRALLPGYRRAGWTPPELLPADELRELDSDVWAGLFVSGELERLERAARVGKELSSANLAGLKDAIDRIDEGVTTIRALVKRVEAGAERAAVDAPPADDFERALSDALAARLAVV
jgi:hypothetical protein